MSVSALLDGLHRRGVRFRIDGERLRWFAPVAYMAGKVEWGPMANLLFAVAGFAGGLITAKAGEK